MAASNAANAGVADGNNPRRASRRASAQQIGTNSVAAATEGRRNANSLLVQQAHSQTQECEKDRRMLVDRLNGVNAIAQRDDATEHISPRRLGALQAETLIQPEVFGIEPPHQADEGQENEEHKQPTRPSSRCRR